MTSARSSGKPRLARGSSTLEILIAMAVLTLALTAMILVFSSNQAVAVDTQTSDEALGYAEAQLEAARAAAGQDFALVNPKTASVTSGPLTFSENLDVTQFDLFHKQATSTVSWQIGGHSYSVVLSTLFTNPSAIHGGNTCGSVLSGDWTHPIMHSYALGADILNDTSSGFPVTSIQTFDKKLYATVDNTNGNNYDTFFILDIHDPANKPSVLKRLDNAPVGRGLNAVAVDGSNYAYVANAYDANFFACRQANNCAQLQVIRVADPASASVVTNFKLPTSTPPYVYATGGSDEAVGKSIAYDGHYVYLGLSTTGSHGNGPGFHIIDVSNPLSPQWVGSWPVASPNFGNSGAPINSIVIRGHYAYLAHPKGLTGAPNEELTVVDISNPKNPQRVAGFDSATGIGGNGKAVSIIGPTLYFGRTATNINGQPDVKPEFFILNDYNPTSIPAAPLGSLSASTSESVNGLIIRDYLAFLIESDKLQTWRIDVPAHLSQYASDLILPPGQGGGQQGTASDCEGNYLFIGSQSSNDKGWISIVTGA